MFGGRYQKTLIGATNIFAVHFDEREYAISLTSFVAGSTVCAIPADT
jgi:hypothetical protein